MTQTWFVDTGYVIALVSPRDRFHAVAKQLAEQIKVGDVRLVTSQAVILEIGAALSRLHFRAAAVRLIETLQTDPSIDVIPLSDALLQRAFALFRDRSDKEWSLTDCVSFEIMRERDIADALTPDAHFEQAAFKALMLS